jgi:hypothetical protein
METTLNLIWLVVTIAAVCIWRFRWSVSRENPRHSTRIEVIAIICVLALLFPVISLTDDLHPEIVPADTVSSKRNHCLLVAGNSHPEKSKSLLHAHAFYALSSHSFLELEIVASRILPPEISFPFSSSIFIGQGRAPPSRLA